MVKAGQRVEVKYHEQAMHAASIRVLRTTPAPATAATTAPEKPKAPAEGEAQVGDGLRNRDLDDRLVPDGEDQRRRIHVRHRCQDEDRRHRPRHEDEGGRRGRQEAGAGGCRRRRRQCVRQLSRHGRREAGLRSPRHGRRPPSSREPGRVYAKARGPSRTLQLCRSTDDGSRRAARRAGIHPARHLPQSAGLPLPSRE